MLTNEQVRNALAHGLADVEMPPEVRERVRAKVMAEVRRLASQQRQANLAEAKASRDQAVFAERDHGTQVNGVTLFA